jgi:DNA polymerase III, delta subunit
MNAAAALQHIRAGRVRPVYLCWGQETYLMREFVQGALAAVVEEPYRDFAVSKYDLQQTPLAAVLDDAETAPFLAPVKVVIAEEARFFTGARDKSAADHDIDRLSEYLLHPAEHTVLIFTVQADKLDERKKIVKTLRDQNAVVDCPTPGAGDLHAWMHRQAEELGFRIEQEAVEYVLLNTGPNLQFLRRELEKLAVFAGESGTVTKDDAAQVAVRSVEQNVFEMIDEMVAGRTGRAAAMLNELIRQREEPVKIVALLARQFRLILQAKELSERGFSAQEMAAQIGVPPFVAKRVVQQAARYSFAQLSAMLERLAELDYRMKTGKVDKRLGLELLLLHPAERASEIRAFR